MKTHHLLIFFGMILLSTVPLIRNVAAQSPIERYIDESLRSNLGLAQKRIDLEKSLESLREARGLFFPDITVETRYSVAGGGRTIDFPIGDLLNPAYQSLNKLLADAGADPSFPVLENQEVRFLRPQEQDTRIRITQPLFQPQVVSNYQIYRHLAASQSASVDVYKNALVRDVRNAYFQFLSALQAVEIYKASLHLVDENLHANQSLFRNAKVTHDVVLRAQTEMLTVSQQLAVAEKDRDLAQSYFNFLLNRPLDATIEVQPLDGAVRDADLILTRFTDTSADSSRISETWETTALSRRPELVQIRSAIDASEASFRAARNAYLPTVALAVDAGYQGTSYSIKSDAPYEMVSFVLQWNVFNGFQDQSRVARARLERNRLEVQRTEIEQQIRLQVQDALRSVRVARSAVESAGQRVSAAREGYRLVSRRYEEGMVNQIELLDARTTMTTAELNATLSRADLYSRMAELDFSLATAASFQTTRYTSR